MSLMDKLSPCIQNLRQHKQYAGCTTCQLMDMESENARLSDDLARMTEKNGASLRAWLREKEENERLLKQVERLRGALENIASYKKHGGEIAFAANDAKSALEGEK